MVYIAFKHFHLTTVGLSVLLLIVRYGLLMVDYPLSRQRWLKIVPHIIDTLLLASGIGLCVILHQYPWVMGWLAEKLILVVAYIVCGLFTIKLAHTKRGKTIAFVAALICIALIANLAFSKVPYILPMVL